MHPNKPHTFWPLGIVVASCLYVSGVGVCSFLACTHKSELVSEKYYDQEIRYQSRIDSLIRTRQLASRASASFDNATSRIIISLPAEHAGKISAGTIELYRPSAAGLDKRFSVQLEAKGFQALDATSLPQGLWNVRVTWSADGADYYFDQKLAVGPADMQAKLAAMTACANASIPIRGRTLDTNTQK